MSTAIDFGRVGIYNEEFPSIKSPDPTELGKMVTHYMKLQLIKLNNPLNMWLL